MSGENAEDVPKCLICGDIASGVHFSVMVCRACAGRFSGNCEIGKDVRCCCRACRLKKCEEMGMKADAVQRHRDRIGPRKRPNEAEYSNARETESESSPSTKPGSSEAAISPSNSTSDGFRPHVVHLDQEGRSFAQLTSCASSSSVWTNRMTAESADQLEQSAAELPLISEMIRGYKKALALQRTARNLNETTNFNRLFDSVQQPTTGTYREDIAAIHAAVPIVSEMINSHFRPLEKFETHVKWTLFRQFFSQFIIVKRSYLSAQHFSKIDDPRCMISPDHYCSLDELDRFFDVEQCKTEPVRMASIFKPTLTRINAMITNPLRQTAAERERLANMSNAFNVDAYIHQLIPQAF
ncbi:Nuclear hormone receptor family member nhr-12 [Aphelenchoides fujianensis]|nr:Nuclear hormone receptor family member nhr-12 [Aphelenchoides fujianensis]